MEKISSSRIKTLDSLMNHIEENVHDLPTPNCALFLGAGCSISSNIKSGSQIIELCKKLSFIKTQSKGIKIIENGNEAINQFIDERYLDFTSFVEKKHQEFKIQIEDEKEFYLGTLPKSVFDSNKKKSILWEEYKSSFFESSLYGKWFETYSENPIERQKLIEKEIENGVPSTEYLILAYLINMGKFNNIFTTNFDDLVNDSLIEFIGKKSRIYAHNEVANFIDIHSKRPNIIKLHGDYLFQNIKNTEKETYKLSENMEVKLREALSRLNLIVIGYGGSDYSVMNALLKIKQEYHFGLYWCSRNIEGENWRVKHLINSTKNSFFIEYDGFESFTDKLYEVYHNEIQFYPVADKIESYKKIVSESLEKLNNRIEFTSEVRDFENPTKLITPNKKVNIFLDIKGHKEKIEYLKELNLQSLSLMIHFLTLKSPQLGGSFLNELVKSGVLTEKIKEYPINIISSSLTRLFPVSNNLISNIISENKSLFYLKYKEAPIGQRLGVSNELKKINPIVISEIIGDVKYSDFDLQNVELRYLERLVHTDEFNIAYDEQKVIEKIINAPLGEIRTFLSKIDISKSTKLLSNLSIELFREKIEESTISVIGQTITTIKKIDPLFAKKLYRENYRIIYNKMIISDILPISETLAGLIGVDKVLTKQLIYEIPPTTLRFDLNEQIIGDIPGILSRIFVADASKAHSLFNGIDSDALASKIEKEIRKFNGFGEIASNFKNIDEDKTRTVYEKIDIDKISERLAIHASTLSPRAFLQSITSLSRIIFVPTCKIIKQVNKNYLINTVLKSSDTEFYLRDLPNLLKIFEYNATQTEAAIFLSKYLLDNFSIFEQRVGSEVANETKMIMRKYIDC